MASGGGSGGSGSGGNYNKAGALLLALVGGMIGFIVLFGGGGSDPPKPIPTTVVTSAPTTQAAPAQAAATRPPATANAQPGGIDRNALRGKDPNSVVLTITAFGMPARGGAQAQNPSQERSQGTFDSGLGTDFACYPDTPYPNPCVSYLVVERGATVVVTAGDSRAGFWPVFDSLRGSGCDLTGGEGRDVTCTLSLCADTDLVAMYSGSDSVSGDYQYPKCPAGEARQRAAASSAWVARCQ